MSPLHTIETQLRALGYRPDAICRNYSFANVLSEQGEERNVALAAFTHLPHSYRSAAFGVVTDADSAAALADRRALGAPILFSIGHSDIGVWRVGAESTPRLLERVDIDALDGLFERNSERWRPDSVHRAKSLVQGHATYQFDFVDLGLLPAIEHEVETKLDRLLHRVIQLLLNGATGEAEDTAFRTTFRLLAAKILLDRNHPRASGWHGMSVVKVLEDIEAYYNLGGLSSRTSSRLSSKAVTAAWRALQEAISFRNISSDSLAFVYENTLVTTDTRKRFGTHSTPRPVAEYVVSRLEFSQFDLEKLSIYEPFAGAGAFLVAALRHLRDLLPTDLTDKKRHEFLVRRITGAEIDSFASEVSTLSLILADYPNANGWRIATADLFETGALARGLKNATVVLCNPPWEDFAAEERARYPHIAELTFSKPMAVLSEILDAQPHAIGIVLPQGFLRQQQYADLRQRVADLYGRVELTSLPDRIFQQAGFEAAVLVASEHRAKVSPAPTKLLSAIVQDQDRDSFLVTGMVSDERRRVKRVESGDLWIGQLDELWEHLERNPRLGNLADVYRGLQWETQAGGVADKLRKGFSPGVFKPADSLTQFEITKTVFLNVSPADAKYPGPLGRPWKKPKVLTNVARMSRGPWRLCAAYDQAGLVASQAFFGIWPKEEWLSGELLEAILNSPLANAFMGERASNQHFTNELLKQLPIPKMTTTMGALSKLVSRYREARRAAHRTALQSADLDALLNRLLIEIDAEVLKAYALPPRLERRLLEFFRGHEHERRVGHTFQGWLPADFTAYIPLHEYLGPLVEQNRGPWALGVFKPAPEEEAAAMKRYVR